MELFLSCFLECVFWDFITLNVCVTAVAILFCLYFLKLRHVFPNHCLKFINCLLRLVSSLFFLLFFRNDCVHAHYYINLTYLAWFWEFLKLYFHKNDIVFPAKLLVLKKDNTYYETSAHIFATGILALNPNLVSDSVYCFTLCFREILNNSWLVLTSESIYNLSP